MRKETTANGRRRVTNPSTGGGGGDGPSGGDPEFFYSATGDITVGPPLAIGIAQSNAFVLGTCCGGQNQVKLSSDLLGALAPPAAMCFGGVDTFSFTGALREFNSAQGTLHLHLGFHAPDTNGKQRQYDLEAETDIAMSMSDPLPPAAGTNETPIYRFPLGTDFIVDATGNKACTGSLTTTVETTFVVSGPVP